MSFWRAGYSVAAQGEVRVTFEVRTFVDRRIAALQLRRHHHARDRRVVDVEAHVVILGEVEAVAEVCVDHTAVAHDDHSLASVIGDDAVDGAHDFGPELRSVEAFVHKPCLLYTSPSPRDS